MKTISILTCETAFKANIIKGRLNNEGIECFLTNQNFSQLRQNYGNMLGTGIQVIINKKDLKAAHEILKDSLVPANIDLVCPKCGSENISIGLGKRNGLFLNILIAILMVIPIGNLKPKYYCKDCYEEIN